VFVGDNNQMLQFIQRSTQSAAPAAYRKTYKIVETVRQKLNMMWKYRNYRWNNTICRL